MGILFGSLEGLVNSNGVEVLMCNAYYKGVAKLLNA